MKIIELLDSIQPGPVPPNIEIDRHLVGIWDSIAGNDLGAMKALKLLGRMEKTIWNPPVLSFVIERHGGAVCGSTRAELQNWEVNLQHLTARIVKVGRRQLGGLSERAPIIDLAQELCDRIVAGAYDEKLRRFDDGSVKVLAHKVFPTDSGFKSTVAGRRKNLQTKISALLSKHGWTTIKRGYFAPPQHRQMV